MYSIRTSYGTTHQYIHSWKKWELDDDFIEFEQGRYDGKYEKTKLIIKKEYILSISKHGNQ